MYHNRHKKKREGDEKKKKEARRRKIRPNSTLHTVTRHTLSLSHHHQSSDIKHPKVETHHTRDGTTGDARRRREGGGGERHFSLVYRELARSKVSM
jgi:hypothetical protein